LFTTISPTHSLAVVLGSYVFFALVGLFHELGHATAAARYKITPKEVGFGFYLVLPVLYTDISRVWMLDKYKRILVNLAGIYFQLLINLLLCIAYLMSLHWGHSATYLIISFLLTNATLAVYSLNPFFRNDGYWVCSDYFSLPNLSAAAQTYPRKCWDYLRSKGQLAFRAPGTPLKSELLLLSYVIGRLSLVSWLSYLGYTGFYRSLQETIQRINQEGQFANESAFEHVVYLLKVVLICGLFIALAYRTLKPVVLRLLTRLGWFVPVVTPAAGPTAMVASS
jgi:putative peptide zinc metalloprotease protein